MRGNVLGPVDKTVNVLIDRSYPVVKEVFKNLDLIKSAYDNRDAIRAVYENIPSIENIGEAAGHLNRIYQSIDRLDNIQANLLSILEVYNKLEDIQKASEIADKIDSVSEQIKEITTVANNLADIATVSKNISAIEEVSKSIEQIKEVLDSTERAEQAANEALALKNQIDSTAADVTNKANVVNTTYQNVVNHASNAINQITSLSAEKKAELEEISGNYYEPFVSPEGVISWERKHSNEFSPIAAVSIKGPKGDQGDPGTGLKISGEYASVNDLPKTGSVGLTYYISDIGECYTWDTNKRAWVSVGPIKGMQGDRGEPGQSANEILMNPDPVAYFDQIYGKTDLITGDLIVDISGTDPEAVNIFEETLKK